MSSKVCPQNYNKECRQYTVTLSTLYTVHFTVNTEYPVMHSPNLISRNVVIDPMAMEKGF